MKCEKCGAELFNSAKFCHVCGTGYELVEEYRRWLTYIPYNKNEIWAIRKCRSEVYRCIFAYSSLIIAGLINQGRDQEAKYISDHIKDYGKKPGFR